MRQLSEAVGQARETAAAVQRLAVRLDGLVEELEEPVRALAPGLRRLAVVLDDPVIETIPDTLRAVTDEVLPIVQGLRETQQKVAFIAGSTDRIMTFVDETSTRFGSLPGASLLGRRRAGGGWGAAGTGPSTVAQPGAVPAPARPRRPRVPPTPATRSPSRATTRRSDCWTAPLPPRSAPMGVRSWYAAGWRTGQTGTDRTPTGHGHHPHRGRWWRWGRWGGGGRWGEVGRYPGGSLRGQPQGRSSRCRVAVVEQRPQPGDLVLLPDRRRGPVQRATARR